jgi:hypothetical protein
MVDPDDFVPGIAQADVWDVPNDGGTRADLTGIVAYN